jgi:asparagine synthase (glutamine-hydrolysing)
VLAKYTRKHITVALSGDGADELLGGYYKHTAHNLAFCWHPWRHLFYPARWVLGLMPQSRNTPLQNKVRQLKKFSDGILKSHTQRYWDWASFMHEAQAKKLLKKPENKLSYLSYIPTEAASMHQVLLNDISLVLPNDMLFKTDSMSMMHSLEVRVPMLDHELVNFTVSLPSSLKVKKQQRKIILKQAFAHLLPTEIIRKPKHGFEVPMHSWLQGPLSSLLEQLTEKSFIEKQQLFRFEEVRKLIEMNRSFNPYDSSVHLWSLIVFQYWWKKKLSLIYLFEVIIKLKLLFK